MKSFKRTFALLVSVMFLLLCFNFTASAATTVIIEKNIEWDYLISETQFGDLAWATSTDYTGWSKDKTPIGFGSNSGSQKTNIDANGTRIERTTTTNPFYFRKSFTIDDVSKVTDIIFNIDCDDGVRIYINGKQALKFNVTSNAEANAPDPTPNSVIVDYNVLNYPARKELAELTDNLASLLKNGENIIAIELWNDRPSSSDLYFDMSMSIEIDESAAPATQAPATQDPTTQAPATQAPANDTAGSPKTGDAGYAIGALMVAALLSGCLIAGKKSKVQG